MSSLLEFPNEYIVIDVETTGLSPKHDEIIEIAALKFSNGSYQFFNTLINPLCTIDPFITALTGITDEMLHNAPTFGEISEKFQEFIGKNIIVGHNVSFDLRFINSKLESPLNNDFVDTMRISRFLFRSERHHRLSDIIERHDIQPEETYHRAYADVATTNKILNFFRDYTIENGIDLVTESRKRRTKQKKLSAKDITTDLVDFDETTPFFGKYFVFTGTLEKMVRKDAQQHVKDLGGELSNSVTKQTNYLVLGEQDYARVGVDGKSSKQERAEKLKLSGQDIEIIPESVFYDFLEESGI